MIGYLSFVLTHLKYLLLIFLMCFHLVLKQDLFQHLKFLLKFGYYYPLNENEKQVLIKEIKELFNEAFINEIIDLLLNPSKEAIDSLIWIPERLKNNN